MKILGVSGTSFPSIQFSIPLTRQKIQMAQRKSDTVGKVLVLCYHVISHGIFRKEFVFPQNALLGMECFA